jgi:hypothetical protein
MKRRWVFRVGASDEGVGESCIGGRTSHRPDVSDAPIERRCAKFAHSCKGGFQSNQSTERGWNADRAASVCADGNGHKSRSNGSSRTAGTAAREMIRVVRVARGAVDRVQPVTLMPISCMLVLPISNAPALRNRATTVESSLTGDFPKNAVPTVDGYGVMSSSSFTATGTPSKILSALPALMRIVDSRACLITSSSLTAMKAFNGVSPLSLRLMAVKTFFCNYLWRGGSIAVGFCKIEHACKLKSLRAGCFTRPFLFRHSRCFGL